MKEAVYVIEEQKMEYIIQARQNNASDLAWTSCAFGINDLVEAIQRVGKIRRSNPSRQYRIIRQEKIKTVIWETKNE